LLVELPNPVAFAQLFQIEKQPMQTGNMLGPSTFSGTSHARLVQIWNRKENESEDLNASQCKKQREVG
jgi:hypothetical protein